MKGDFTRWTFDPSNDFTRVFQQQGRVHLDADWNEQAAILLHHLRTLAEDVIGPFGVPANPDGTPGEGFRLVPHTGKDGKPVANAYRLLRGRYYVGGLPVENREERIKASPGGPLPDLPNANGKYLLYLDVWERLVTYVQHDLLREVALGGVDTAARAQVAWRVRAEPIVDVAPIITTCRRVRRTWAERVRKWQPANRGSLKARAQAPANREDDDPCLAAPEARYTGENQLYRVEVHNGGTAAVATFKWSRENGSVVFPVLGTKDKSVTLEHLGRDGRFGLQKGQWVELLDDDGELRDPVMLQVAEIDPDKSLVTLEGALPSVDPARHRYLRRWDHAERKGSTLENGALRIEEDGWVELENGVQIRFEAAAPGLEAHSYRAGDYWLIPARTATADVEWPGPFDNPEARPPHGVEHRFAPLGLLTVANGAVTIEDCRTTFGERAQSLNTGRAAWMVFRDPSGGPVPRPAVVVEEPNVGWSKALPARWISADPNTRAPGGATRFELAFHLDEEDLSDVSLSLSLLADNSAKVTLNDRDLGEHKRDADKGFTGEPSRMYTEDFTFFVQGENRLAVEVMNAGEGPMGFVLDGRVGRDRRCC